MLYFFNIGEVSFLDGIEFPEGGNGRRFIEQGSFFLESCFFGIPGSFSQENGIPEDLRGVVGLNMGEELSSGKNIIDPKDELDDCDGEEERELFRREDGRRIDVENGVLDSLETILGRPFLFALEAIKLF